MACLVGDRATTISGTWYNDKLNGLGKSKALTDGAFVGIESQDGVSVTVSEYDMGVQHGKSTKYFFL